MKKFLILFFSAIITLAMWIVVGNKYSDPSYIGQGWGELYVSLLSLFVFLSLASGFLLGKYLITNKNFSKNAYLGSVGGFGCFSLLISTAYLFGVGIGEAFRGNQLYEMLFKLSLLGLFISLVTLFASLVICIYVKSKKYFRKL